MAPTATRRPTHTTSPLVHSVVEVAAPVAVHPGRPAHRDSTHRRGDRRALHLGDRLRRTASMPRRREPTPCQAGRKRASASPSTGSISRRKRSQGAATELTEHVVVAELAFGAAGPELAAQQIAAARDEQRSRADGSRSSAMPSQRATSRAVERAVGAGVAAAEIAEWVIDRVGEHRRQPYGQGDADGVAQAGGVVAGGDAIVVGDAHLDRPPLLEQRAHPAADRRRRRPTGPRGRAVERAEPCGACRGVRRVAGPCARRPAAGVRARDRPAPRRSSSSRSSSAPRTSRSRLTIERERRGTALGDRSVAFVHVDGDPREQQRLGERRRLGRCRPPPSAPVRLRRSVITERSAGRSKTSLTHSRVASSSIGNVGYLAATDRRSAARWRCCHSGVR